mmetsp:Transcript_156152/g.500907  ORF Transcript_156152/g.500907 Transcript_156152/m.500907 type:complete len:206 (+) Transcript_156152:1237-1854(+)
MRSSGRRERRRRGHLERAAEFHERDFPVAVGVQAAEDRVDVPGTLAGLETANQGVQLLTTQKAVSIFVQVPEEGRNRERVACHGIPDAGDHKTGMPLQRERTRPGRPCVLRRRRHNANVARFPGDRCHHRWVCCQRRSVGLGTPSCRPAPGTRSLATGWPNPAADRHRHSLSGDRGCCRRPSCRCRSCCCGGCRRPGSFRGRSIV